MKRRTRRNLTVALFLSAMLALTVWTRNETASVGEPLLADPAAVERVEVRRDDGVAVTLERTGSGWRMLAPEEREIEAGRVDGILDGLTVPSRRSYPVRVAPLAELGLDPPRATVIVDGAEYRFGDVEGVSRLRYLLHDGEVHLVDDLVMFRLIGDW